MKRSLQEEKSIKQLEVWFLGQVGGAVSDSDGIRDILAAKIMTQGFNKYYVNTRTQDLFCI